VVAIRPVVLLTVLAAGVVAVAGTPTSSPRTAADRRTQIDALGKHLDALRKEAEVDARAALVRTFLRYSSDRLGNTADRIRLEDLVEVVKDETAPAEIREEAAKAVVWDQAQRYDPDLDAAGKGLARPRAKFTKKLLLPMLVDKDTMTRAFANNMLQALWPGMRDPDIVNCQPRLKASCTGARVAWEKQLAK
jgi:hypothetical protein